IKFYSKLIPSPNALAVPYADQFRNDDLQKKGLKREMTPMLLVRGDKRSPEELQEKGGLHPQMTNPHGVRQKENSKILDVHSHWEDPGGSGLVSLTPLVSIAQDFSHNLLVSNGF